MTLTPVKTPLLIKKMLPNYIWSLDTSEKIIYLTFDDGPTPEITHWTLNLLKSYQAKATFFCIGHNIEKYPNIFQDILRDGHAIGNHTNNHIKGWKTKTKDYIKNTTEATEIINDQIQYSNIVNRKSEFVNLFRPPYGQISPKQGKKLIELGYKIIMWDVLSFDWDKSIKKEECLNNVVSNTVNGSIVVFHDSNKAAKNMQYALPKVLDYFDKRGYIFKAIGN